jgi:hypothetical protein
MKYYQSLAIAAALAFGLSSCEKKHNDDTCVAGSGGTMSIVTFAIHNGDTLINYDSHPDTAFVKYNATTSPGTSASNFDAYFTSEGGEDHVHSENLKCGDYYVYRTAYDSVANKTYYGGTTVNLPKGGIEKDVYITVN